jgi:hypothetical protein
MASMYRSDVLVGERRRYQQDRTNSPFEAACFSLTIVTLDKKLE